MKRTILTALAGLAALACAACYDVASAQIVAAPAGKTMTLIAVAGPVADDTAATTSYEDVAGASVTYPASLSDPAYTGELIYACYWATGSKATTLSGTVALFVNGAIVADTAKVVTTASLNGSVSSCYAVAPAADQTGNAGSNDYLEAQTVKLQAKSADTAVFTVSDATLAVFRIR